MFNIMYSRYVLTIGALVVIAMVDVLYFSKPKISTKAQHKAYAVLIIANTCILIFEHLIMFAFGLDLPFNVCCIVLQLRDLSMIAYFSFILFYYYAAVNESQYSNLWTMLREEIFTGNKKKLLPHFIFTIIFVVVHFFLPYTHVTKETYSLAFGGPAFYATIAYCVITTLETIIIILFVSKKKIDFSEKASLVWLFSLMLVILFCQPVFTDIAIMGIVSAIYVLGLYFILENPDLEMVETIDSLTKEIDNANRTKFDFLSNVSKEMVSPISTITTISGNILNEDSDSAKLHDNIQQIEAASKNFLEIMNNTLDISNVEGENGALTESNYSLISILNNLVGTIREKLTSEKVKVILKVDNSIPNNLYGDSAKISQILNNVVSNAIKYTEVGKVNISVTQEVKNSKTILKFTVIDTGFGIKEEDYDKVFQKNIRLEEAVSSGAEGTGVGLTIAKNYVDLLEGKIWFDSIYGAGTTFYIEIPQKVVDAETTIGSVKEAEIAYAAEGNKKIDCSNYRILIVEDDHLNLEVTKRLFERYGFKIDTCQNGRECVFKYKKGEKYDMILLDHIMPEMSGIEAMQIIKKLQDYQTPPLVALTANTFTGSRDMYLEEGFDDYLAKPIDVVELDTLIHKFFGKKKD